MKKATPLRAVRKYCLWCMNGQPKEIQLDPSSGCPLFNLRFRKGIKGLRILKQIKLRCKDCCEKASKCDATDCYLFPYKDGHNPSRQGISGPRGGNSQKGGVSGHILRNKA